LTGSDGKSNRIRNLTGDDSMIVLIRARLVIPSVNVPRLREMPWNDENSRILRSKFRHWPDIALAGQTNIGVQFFVCGITDPGYRAVGEIQQSFDWIACPAAR